MAIVQMPDDRFGRVGENQQLDSIQRAIAPNQTAQESWFEARKRLHYLQCEPALLPQQLGLLRAE